MIGFLPAAWSVVGIQAIPTLGSALNTIIPVMNIEAPGVLSWYMLEAGNTGTIIPADANSTTNNVSWHQVL